jgi:excisionase family DNA binding protein
MHATRPPELLRIPEAAERLNVHRASVYRWVVDGRLPAVQLGGRGAPLRISSVELELWLDQMSTVGLDSSVDAPAERVAGPPEDARQSSPARLVGEER